MPSKNVVKEYLENGIYHVYNRGINKSPIFTDEQDHIVFMHLLKTYLSPITDPITKSKTPKTLHNEVLLLQFCLMPNHFHLLIKQKTKEGMTKLMQKTCVAYAKYFNKKYERVGHLFQGVYQAVRIKDDVQFLQVSKYIHLNPIEIEKDLEKYKYSSYLEYIEIRKSLWVDTGIIMSCLKGQKYNEWISPPSRSDLS